MKAISLFGVFALARALVLLGRDIPLSLWSPVAYLWQDLLAVLLFAGFERVTARRPWISWMVYVAIVLYIAINLPLVRYLSSPLTLPMLRATRGALADSIRHQLTGENLGLIGLVLCAAAALPPLTRCVCLRARGAGKRSGELQFGALFGRADLAPERSSALRCSGSSSASRPKTSRVMNHYRFAAAVVILVALGPYATARVDTGGLHRNVFMALLETAMPRVAAKPIEDGDWRKSPMAGADLQPPPFTEDLSRFKGAAEGRNVIVILLESTGARYLKPYGAQTDPMPYLTSLADQAIQFENACAVYPESIKGLFSVLCSRYPAFDTPPEVCAGAATLSIAARLAAEGYRTALFHSGRFLYLGMENIVRQRGFQTLEDAGDIGGNRQSSFGVDEPATVKRILNWIDSVPTGGKFFLTYLPVAGHHPYEYPGPGPFPASDDRGRYLNALHYSDRALEELFEGLRARRLFEKTLFVIFGDHGEAFGQHAGNYGHTLYIYEENIRVPYWIVAPRLIRGPIRVRRTASLIDTTPTILDLLGLPAPQDYQGGSLLEPRRQMALFYTDYSLALAGLRDGCWKFIEELGSGQSRLFDLVHDEDETRNLANQYPERVEAYRKQLQSWAAAQRDLILHPRDHILSKR